MSDTMLLIHGMWGGDFVWERWRPFMEARGWQVRAPALRHHDSPAGAAAPALGRTGLQDYLADLEALIDAMGEPPVLVGHGMGGLLAQMLAARGRARAMVLLAPMATGGHWALAPGARAAFRRILLTGEFWRRPHGLRAAEAEAAMLERLPADRRHAEFARFTAESGRAIFETALWFLDRGKAARFDAAKAACPALVLVGARDRFTPPAMVRAVARRLPGPMDYREFRDQGHWLVGEDGWETVAGTAADWLDRLRAGATAA